MDIETNVILEQIRKIEDRISEMAKMLGEIGYKVTLIDAKLRENGAYPKKPGMNYHFPDDEQLEKWEEQELAAAKNSLSAAQNRLADAINGIEQFNCTYTTPKNNGFQASYSSVSEGQFDEKEAENE